MKYLIIALLMFTIKSHSQELCQLTSQDVNTPVPKELKDAKIIVRTKDGKEQELNANDFKVVKRKQQFKVKEKIISQSCEPEIKIVEVEKKTKERKNIIMLGIKKDYTDISVQRDNGGVKVYSNKALVPDLSYYRRQIFDTRVGAGLGVDTNVTLRGFLGYEF